VARGLKAAGLVPERLVDLLASALRRARRVERIADAILREPLASEGQALALYKELLLAVEGKSVMLEEYARQMVQAKAPARSIRCSGTRCGRRL
jgi:hypothetical protein